MVIPRFIRPLAACGLLFSCITLARAGHSLDLNVGVSLSKSVLGLSYTAGRDQVNLGVRGFAYGSRDGLFLQPGVAYNRYLTNNGFYGTLAFIPTYRSRDVTEPTFDMSGNRVGVRVVERQGWESGALAAGLGKSWQFTRWGLHADAGITTPASAEVGTEAGVYFGGAFSWRFPLGD